MKCVLTDNRPLETKPFVIWAKNGRLEKMVAPDFCDGDDCERIGKQTGCTGYALYKFDGRKHVLVSAKKWRTK